MSKKKKSERIESAPENLDKVRELLFGPQLNGVETRIDSLEQHLAESAEQTRTGIDALERFSKDELAALSKRIEAESQRREKEHEKLQDSLSSGNEGLTHKFNDLQSDLADAEKSIRSELRQSEEAFQIKIDLLQENMREIEERLASDKVGRSSLASFFRDMATQLEQGRRMDLKDVLTKPETKSKISE